MLGSHHQCESVGELIHLPMDMAMNNKCTCGQPMRSCPLWPEVIRSMGVDPLRKAYSLNLGYAIAKFGDKRQTSLLHKVLTRFRIAMRYADQRYGLNWLRRVTSEFDQGIANTLSLYERVREVTGKNVIVDSSKHYLGAVGLYTMRPETTRIILLVRDGRGVYYSGLKRGFGRRYSLGAWNKHYRRALPLLEKHVHEAHRMTIHYEDLVRDTPGTLDRVCRFLGINFDETMLDFRSTVHHNVNGNDMKFRSASELRLDVAWKEHLKGRDLAYFERRAGDLNRKFGYL